MSTLARRVSAAWVFAAALGICFAAEGVKVPAPALPFFDWKACPGEGCNYGPWTAQKRIAVYDTWRPARKTIAQLAVGQSVTAVSGVVITTKPGLIRLDRDLPEQQLSRGDTILTYTYHGEGFSAVWFKGAFYSEFDISFAKWPDGAGCGSQHCAATYVDLGKKEWWAQIKLKSGAVGWVNMDTAQFRGADALSESAPKP